MKLALQQTSDGSHTLCNLDMNETYHSIHGAVNESQHVFIRAGLEPVLAKKDNVSVLEVGFGTGLNALLTLQKAVESQSAGQPCKIHYTSLEPYPVPLEVAQQLNYAHYLGKPAFYHPLLVQMHEVAWQEPQEIVEGVSLKKMKTTLADFEPAYRSYDLIYFDPFPPTAQPYLWDKPALAKLTQSLVPGGIWVTYGAKGQFRRDLRELGMQTERLPGPPGKREMTRAVKL